MDEISFGKWLSRARRASGLTQADLAKKISCATITLRKIEADQRHPSIQIIERIAENFNIPPFERSAFIRFVHGDVRQIPYWEPDKSPWEAKDSVRLTKIPAPLNPLLGREDELSLLSGYLLDNDIRLVTLAGPPGVGKTRLSQEVARHLILHFQDGIFYIPVDTLETKKILILAILKTLGVSLSQRLALSTQISDVIQDKRVLLILDDVEHLIEATGSLVYDLLVACPNLKIFVTSRESLRVTGEHVYSLSPLKTPTGSILESIDVPTARRYPAVKLFEERARAVQAEFSLNDENVKEVAAICNHLDGLPLAIELLAARIDLMPPNILLAQLTDHLILHTRGSNSSPEDQQSLYQAIDWSYRSLSSDEKRLFMNLSVFSGGFTREDAGMIFLKMFEHKDIEGILDSLCNRHLVQETSEACESPRFYMLATIQRFAAEQLKVSGHEQAARELYLDYFQKFSEMAYSAMQGNEKEIWLHRLENENENLQSALIWCISSRRTKPALMLFGALSQLWLVSENYSEVFCWFDQLQELSDTKDHPFEYARLLLLLARARWITGEVEQARAGLEESLRIGLLIGAEGERVVAESLNQLDLVNHRIIAAVPQIEMMFDLNIDSDGISVDREGYPGLL